MSNNINTRREREKLEMRQLIIDAAIDIYKEQGYDRLSLRGIAQRIEYSAGTIYLYFKDKDNLFHAMHEWAFEQLFDKFAALNNIENPVSRLQLLGNTFVNFALENPELYELMFILNEPMCIHTNPTDWPCGQKTYNILRDTVQECIDKDMLKTKDTDLTSFIMMSSVHGMVSLHIRNRLPMYEHLDKLALINVSIQQLLNQFIK